MKKNEEENLKKNPETDFEDMHMRLFAEFKNYKERTNKEKEELQKHASEKVLKSLFPVLDNFERAIQTSSEENEGMKLIFKQLMGILNTHGLKVMEVIGLDFSDEIAEAITLFPSEENKGKIIEVVETGYQLHEKVIRYSKVVVGS